MRVPFALLFSFTGLVSCGSMHGHNKAKPTEAATQQAATPMSCMIEGQVIQILPAYDADNKSTCAHHPCRAVVKVISISGCGAGVSIAAGAGSTMEMRFVYTLDNTRHIFPEMKAVYPGLKKGQYFSARAEQRLKPGTEGEFVVYAYSVK
jgi:hypothetical protein